MVRFVITLCMLCAAPALAHTRLVNSVPADKAELATAPKEVVLTFAESVVLTSLKVVSSDGTKTTLAPLPETAIKEAHVPLPTLAPARYTLQWRATSDDGHVINGELTFTIKK